jgi:DNA-binding response OmpR family regulator
MGAHELPSDFVRDAAVARLIATWANWVNLFGSKFLPNRKRVTLQQFGCKPYSRFSELRWTHRSDRAAFFTLVSLKRGTDTGQLFKQGREVKLQEQPFRLLVALLGRQGRVVSRQELKESLWPAPSFIDT